MRKGWMMAIFILVLFCVTLTMAIAEAEDPIFYISTDGEYTTQAIKLTQVKYKMYLFLPGNINLADMKIGYSGAKSMSLNGTELTGGENALMISMDEKNELKINGKKKIEFTVMQGSPNLPVVYVTTETGNLEKIHRTKKYKEAGALYMTNGEGKAEYDGPLEHVKMRGNASTGYPKKNYQIKLEKGTDLLGFGKAKKWILTGNWLDKSFIRNEMTYDLADYMGMEYVPEHQQVELYVNHEYMGLYLFSEKVEINKGRIEINDLEKDTEKINDKELSEYKDKFIRVKGKSGYKGFEIPNNPEDISGGYLIEYEVQRERYWPEPSGYETKHGLYLVIKSPEYASLEQAAYISEIMQGFENAIWSSDGIDDATGKHYYEYVDLTSLALKYMINEFSKNYDGNASSEFFYKPEDSISTLVYAGPVWDMDNSYGDFARDYNKNTLLSPKGLFIGKAQKDMYWWPNVYKHKEFREEVQKIYTEKLKTGIQILLGYEEDPAGKLKSLDGYGERINESVAMNYVLFPELKNNRFNAEIGRNLAENIEYLRNYITKRGEYLEEAWFEEE